MQISLEELQQWFYSSFLSNSNLQREEFKQKISNYMAQNIDKMIQQMCEIVKTSSLTSSLRQVVLTALVQHTGVKKEGRGGSGYGASWLSSHSRFSTARPSKFFSYKTTSCKASVPSWLPTSSCPTDKPSSRSTWRSTRAWSSTPRPKMFPLERRLSCASTM